MGEASDDFKSKLKQIFLEESQDLLHDLERQFSPLLEEKDPQKLAEVFSDIFRIVHSLKATVASQGFTASMGFLHLFEQVLDDIREGKLAIEESVIALCGDALGLVQENVGKLLEAEEDSDYQDSPIFKNLTQLNSQGVVVDSSEAMAADSSVAEAEEQISYFKVVLRLPHDLLKTGTDPLYFFREFEELGEILNLSCNTNAVPNYENLEIDRLYLSWELVLKTGANKEKVALVFLFLSNKEEIIIEDISNKYTLEGDEKLLDQQRIGDILVSRGQVEPDAVDQIADKLPRIGEALVLEKKVSATEVKKAVTQQQEAKEKTAATVRVDIAKLDALANLVGELVISESILRNMTKEISEKKLRRQILGKFEETSRVINDLQNQVMNTRMVPVDIIFSQFHRLVRDLSKSQNKNIRLVLSGQETELDKLIIERISNPLKHIVRNAIDHGIETPEERSQTTKNQEAIVQLKAYHKEGTVFIEVQDDGKGLDRAAILAKAINQGLIGPDEEVSDDYIYDMILQPGFSTAATITDVSGRGVGMDVVKRAVTDLRGTIAIKTELGKGTSFIIKLPLTLAIIDGLLFSLADQIYIIPLLAVNDTLKPNLAEIKTLEGRGEFLNIRGQVNALIRLRHLFFSGQKKEASTQNMVLNIKGNHKSYSLLVDKIIGQQQIVIKSLEENYEKVEGFSGVTILGDGKVAPIIDPDEVINLYKKSRSPVVHALD